MHGTTRYAAGLPILSGFSCWGDLLHCQVIEEDFVESRRENVNSMTVDDLHSLLGLARYRCDCYEYFIIHGQCPTRKNQHWRNLNEMNVKWNLRTLNETKHLPTMFFKCGYDSFSNGGFSSFPMVGHIILICFHPRRVFPIVFSFSFVYFLCVF